MDEMQIGDMVRFVNASFDLGVVTAKNKVNQVFVLDGCGFQEYYPAECLTKTGRKVDVKSFLEQIRASEID